METVKIADIKDDILQIKYQGKQLQINITRELLIDESLMNSQLKSSPSNYAFLCTLRDKAIRKRDKLEKERDRQFSELWLYFKNSDSKMTNDSASHRATSSKKFQMAEDRYLKASYKANQLISICRAYESRERILQTLSANLRKEK